MEPLSWNRRHMAALWGTQIVLLLGLIAYTGWIMYVTNAIANEDDEEGYYEIGFYFSSQEGAITGYLFGVTVFTILFDIAEIILYSKGKLKAILNVRLQSVKTAIWTVTFILTCWGNGLVPLSGLLIFFNTSLFVVATAQLFIAARMRHRQRKGMLARGCTFPLGDQYNNAHFHPQVDPPSYNVGHAYPNKPEDVEQGRANPFGSPSAAPSYPAEMVRDSKTGGYEFHSSSVEHDYEMQNLK